jgi:5-formyltetrahydrofolate cyclo-ligase
MNNFRYTFGMEAKIELRRAIKERLSKMSANDRRVESQVIVRELKKILPPGHITIAAFMPYLDEPDISPLLTELLEQKNVICMGKVEGNAMKMHRISALSDVHRNPVSNILEPKDHNHIDESEIGIAIIPGRAFTKEGLRMGRGNGGFDRWIEELKKKNPSARTIGVCFDCQIVTNLPTEPHDRPVDVVVTPTSLGRSL